MKHFLKQKNMTNYSAVIKDLVDKHGGNQSEIARKLSENSDFKVSSQRIGQYIGGKRNPKQDFIDRWKVVFGDDIETMIKQGKVSHETNVETRKDIPDAIRKELLDVHPEYWLVPKNILENKYRVIEASVLDTQNRVINQLLVEVSAYRIKMMDQLKELESKSPEIKGAK